MLRIRVSSNNSTKGLSLQHAIFFENSFICVYSNAFIVGKIKDHVTFFFFFFSQTQVSPLTLLHGIWNGMNSTQVLFDFSFWCLPIFCSVWRAQTLFKRAGRNRDEEWGREEEEDSPSTGWTPESALARGCSWFWLYSVCGAQQLGNPSWMARRSLEMSVVRHCC